MRAQRSCPARDEPALHKNGARATTGTADGVKTLRLPVAPNGCTVGPTRRSALPHGTIAVHMREGQSEQQAFCQDGYLRLGAGTGAGGPRLRRPAAASTTSAKATQASIKSARDNPAGFAPWRNQLLWRVAPSRLTFEARKGLGPRWIFTFAGLPGLRRALRVALGVACAA